MEKSGGTHSCRSSSMRRSLNSAMSKPATVSVSSPPRGWKFDSSSMLSSSRSSSANSFSSSSSSSSSSPEPSEDAWRYAEDDSMNVDDGSYEEDEEDCAGADAAADVDASVVIFGSPAAVEVNSRNVGRFGRWCRSRGQGGLCCNSGGWTRRNLASRCIFLPRHTLRDAKRAATRACTDNQHFTSRSNIFAQKSAHRDSGTRFGSSDAATPHDPLQKHMQLSRKKGPFVPPCLL